MGGAKGWPGLARKCSKLSYSSALFGTAPAASQAETQLTNGAAGSQQSGHGAAGCLRHTARRWLACLRGLDAAEPGMTRGLTLIHRTRPALTATVSGSQHLTNKAHNAPLQVSNLEVRMRRKKKNIRATPSRYEESNRRAATSAQKQRYQLSRSSPVNRARLKPICI